MAYVDFIFGMILFYMLMELFNRTKKFYMKVTFFLLSSLTAAKHMGPVYNYIKDWLVTL